MNEIWVYKLGFGGKLMKVRFIKIGFEMVKVRVHVIGDFRKVDGKFKS